MPLGAAWKRPCGIHTAANSLSSLTFRGGGRGGMAIKCGSSVMAHVHGPQTSERAELIAVYVAAHLALRLSHESPFVPHISVRTKLSSIILVGPTHQN